jgi:hypothetical protein
VLMVGCGLFLTQLTDSSSDTRGTVYYEMLSVPRDANSMQLRRA